jgi:hypothetical protein
MMVNNIILYFKKLKFFRIKESEKLFSSTIATQVVPWTDVRAWVWRKSKLVTTL